MTIYEKILSIMKTVQRLQKDDNVEFGSTKYKALSEEKVTTIMRSELIKHGLVVYPIHQNACRTGNITHVDVIYRMVNIENPEEYIDIASAGDGADTQDKGSGKAMTYAYKYMWLWTFALPTGEDPDKVSSAELDDMEKRRKESLDNVVTCECCGYPITPVKGDDGKTISVATILKRGKDDFSAKYCYKCLQLAVKKKKAAEALNGYDA